MDEAPTATSSAPSAAAKKTRSPRAAAPTQTATVKGRTVTYSHGVSNGEIEIGIPWFDTSDLKAVVGPAADSVGDSKKQAQAVVDYINANGGVAGLKIKPLYRQLQVASLVKASGRDQEAQAACADWEQDHKAFAFLVVIAPNDNYLQCAQDTNTPLLTGGGAVTAQMVDEVEYAKMPNLIYNPSGMVANLRERMLVQQMVKAGVLGPKTKVGVVSDGTSAMVKRVVDGTLLPELRRHGVPVVAHAAASDCLDAPYSSHVLQMKQAGVTHVYFAGGYCGSGGSLAFMIAARNQRWYPQYVLSSEQSPSIVQDDTKPNVHGAGWQPHWDVAAEEPVSANAALCAKIMRDAGQPEHDALNLGDGYCDTLLFLHAALRGSTDITPEGIAAGAAALGDGWSPLMSYRANFGAGHHYGIDEVRHFAYGAECGCIEYISGPARIR